jgi:TonB-linked SusC/RagA family outer membrane protein
MKKKRDDCFLVCLKVKRIMKITTLLLLIGIIHISAMTYAQNHRISVSVEGGTFYDVISQIEKQSEFMFFYNSDDIDNNLHLNVQAKNKLITDVLNEITHNNGLSYQITGKHIILTKSPGVHQNNRRTINGTVIGDSGEPIIGANVVEKGTTNGVITDIDGRFSLSVAENVILQVTYIGYIAQEIVYRGQNNITVVLREDAQALDEVVVVGYGVQKKVNLTGSVENIDGAYLSKKTMGQTSMALQGASPGVTVQQNSGEPGKDTGTIRIRGIGTLSSSNPLILVDGVEADINSVDPNDIESISVLKDAASSAIYGSRAANGVILISTYRAQKDVFRISYGNYVGWQSPTALPKMVSGYDHMVMLNEANRNVGRAEPFGEDYINEYAKYAPSDQYPETDWHDVMLKKKALQHNHHVSINGGGEKVSILGALSYLNQDGITLNTNYERINLRLNTDVRVRKELTARFDVVFMTGNNETPSAGMPWYFLNRYPKNLQGKNENNSWGVGFDGTNTWATEADGGVTSDRNYATNLNFKIDYQPIEGLNLSFQYAPKWSFYHNLKSADICIYIIGKVLK